VTARIEADGTFRAQLQPARHAVAASGLPPGYSLRSIRLGSQDVTTGLVVGAEDISDLVVTVCDAGELAAAAWDDRRVPAASMTDARVELTGRVIGVLEARVQKTARSSFPPRARHVSSPGAADS
jgi:hypothetical protein